MDTVKTRTELITMAADELGIIASGQSLEPEDQQKIDSRVDGLFAELGSRGVCTVSDDDAILIEWSEPLAILLANSCATIFGKAKLGTADREMIEDRLRVMVNNNPPAKKTLSVDRSLTRGRYGLSLSRWTSGV